MSGLVTVKKRRGTSAEWSAANPILADGEEGFEKDTKKSKVGDGVTRWNTLGYVNAGTGSGTNTGTPVDYITIRRSDGSTVQATLDINNVWTFSGQNTGGGGGTVDPPDEPPVTTDAIIDDDEVGTSNMQVEYTGSAWVDANISGHTYHYTFTTGETATLRFTGTGIACKFTFEPTGGIGTYKLDLADPVSFDTYNATQTFDTTGFTLTGLTNGAHTLIIRNTGTKNAANTGSAVIAFASATVTQSAGVLLPPVMGSATALTGGGTFAAGTYRAVGTSLNSAGNETNASNEVTVPIAASGRATFPFTVATGAAKTRVYMTAVGGAAGSEQWRVAELTAPTATVTVTSLGSTAGNPPGSNPTVSYDQNGLATNSLVISSSTGDTNGIVTGTMSLVANVAGKAVTDVCISVRDASNLDVGTLDFPHLGPQTVGTTPYSPAAQTITLAAGTYSFFVSYNIAGTWYKLQSLTRTLTVTQATTGSNTGGGTDPGSNPMLSVGARSGLPWNSGVQGYGQNATIPQSYITARQQFEQRGKQIDAQQQAQYCYSYADLANNMQTLTSLPQDALAVIDITPGWAPGATADATRSWNYISTGAVDSYFFNLGVNSANYCWNSRGGRPWSCRLGWEMNGWQWYPWQVKGTGYDTDVTFKAGWARAAKQIKAGAASTGHGNMVVMTLSFSGLDRNSGYAPLTQLYPGDDAVDIVSIDFYDHNQWDGRASTATSFGWETILDQMMSFCISRGKWMAVDEWGLVNKTTPGDGQGGDNPSFFTGFYNWMRKKNPLLNNQPNYTRMAYELYFEDIDNANVHSSLWADARNPLSRARYGQELAKGGTA